MPTFTDALQPHYADAVRYCRGLCARESVGDADDVLQESLLLALRGYDKLRDPEKFRSWLFRIITREYRASRRKSFWRKFVPIQHVREDAMPRVYTGRLEREGEGALLAALGELTQREREALLLFEIAGLSLEELKVVQGDASISAVKSRLSRSRSRVRLLLVMDHAKRAVPGSEAGIEDATIAALEARKQESR